MLILNIYFPLYRFVIKFIGCLRKGFDDNEIFEIHGQWRRLQCVDNCKGKTWDLTDDYRTLQQMPACPDCGLPSRPNVFLFSDRE
jgi:NAD-dependent SIR2 family protein deacetylase